MRGRLQTITMSAVFLGVVSIWGSLAEAKIDAVRGRKYKITKRHGPWMILVATFHAPPKDRRGEGMTPEQAADELVYELRRKGIPAYAFQQEGTFGAVKTIDRSGRRRRSFTAYRGGIAVLAGNYPSSRDKLAQATLKYIKKFRPKFLRDIEGKAEAGDNTQVFRLRNGGLYRSTPGRPTPFSGAHMTPNPLLSPAELNSRKKDPLLLKLNTGSDISLLNNPGKYTLIVKSFYGKSVTAVDSGAYRRKFEKFQVGDSLDKAGRDAWELAVALRKYRKIEAWVFHDHHKSVVTVGAFESRQDPRIRKLIRVFGMKTKQHPKTGQDVLTAEWMTIPPNPRPGQPLQKKWIFDPKPRVMMVPKFAE